MNLRGTPSCNPSVANNAKAKLRYSQAITAAPLKRASPSIKK